MGTCLCVGKLPSSSILKPLEAIVLSTLQNPSMNSKRPGLLSSLFSPGPQRLEARTIVRSWSEGQEELAFFDSLNLSSISQFLDHTAELEGLPGQEEAIENSKWKQLPYWMTSIWLPLGTPFGPSVLQIEGEPIFVGSAAGLKQDLNDIAKLSAHGLGTLPKHYELMRNDPKEFHNLDIESLDETSTLQWIWRVLFDASALAIEHQMPAWSG